MIFPHTSTGQQDIEYQFIFLVIHELITRVDPIVQIEYKCFPRYVSFYFFTNL